MLTWACGGEGGKIERWRQKDGGGGRAWRQKNGGGSEEESERRIGGEDWRRSGRRWGAGEAGEQVEQGGDCRAASWGAADRSGAAERFLGFERKREKCRLPRLFLYISGRKADDINDFVPYTTNFVGLTLVFSSRWI